MKSCSRCQRVPGLCSPRARIPQAKRAGRSEQAKPGGGSFHGKRKVTFLIFLPKPHFRKITLCCVFSVPLSSVRSRVLCLSSLALLSFQGTCPGPASAFRSPWSRGWDPGGCLQCSSPEQPDQHHSVPGRTRALPL